MNKTDRKILLIISLAAIFLVFTSCTVKKISEVDAGKDEGEYSTWTKSGSQFEPVSYVEGIWDSRLVPAFREECIDLNMLLDALRADREKAVAEYGLTKTQGAASYAFKVKGEAVVVEYDSSSRNGLLTIDLTPADGVKDTALQVGPVIKKTALRDSLDFIKFSEVGNQLQFASLADELNNKMKKVVIEPLDLENIAGKTIYFYAAFKLEQSDSIEDIVLTPAVIELKE